MALHGRILSVKQDLESLHYRAIFPTSASLLPTPPPSIISSADASVQEDDTLDLINHYFNLKTNLSQLYEHWAAADPNFKKKAPQFTGVRILQQDAWEALVGFICSSNNNIARISQMVEKLCINYGPLIGHIGTQPFHDFPPPHALTGNGVEQKLRELGFGYRARYIWQTAQMVDEKGLGWLEGLRNPEKPLPGKKWKSAGKLVEGGRSGYRDAHEQLLSLQGVGPKVADCVCLFGLGWGEVVPVDTHVWQIAQKDYKFVGKSATLTKALYDAIANKFRALWGEEAGWAHSVMFTAKVLIKKVEVEKIEKTEIKIKREGSVVAEETVIMATKTRVKRVKEEDEDEQLEIKVEESIKRKTKRRKKA
jgi:N-glycosylase/DNA lyase